MAFEDGLERARAYRLYSSSGMDKRIGELAWATVFRHLSQGVNSRLTLPLPSWECDWVLANVQGTLCGNGRGWTRKRTITTESKTKLIASHAGKRE